MRKKPVHPAFHNFPILWNGWIILFFILTGSIIPSDIWAQHSNITISNAADANINWTPGTYTPTADNANINIATLQTRLQTGNVSVVTARAAGGQPGNVTFSNAVTSPSTSATQYTLSVTAGGNIVINAAISTTPAAANPTRPGNNITLTAGGSVSVAATVTTSGGNASGGNRAGGVAGSVNINGSSGVSISSNITSNGGTSSGNGNGGNGGSINITSTTSIAILANISAIGGTETGSGTGGNGGTFTIAGAGGIRLTGNLTATATTGGTAGNFNISDDNTIVTTGGGVNDGQTAGIISGGNLTKTGIGTFNLAGLNTYPGLTTINAGTLRLGAAGGGTNTPLGTVGSGTSVTANAALDLNGFTLGTSEPLTLNGTGISGGGALINSSATAVTYNGSILTGSTTTIGTTGNITLGANGISGGFDLTKAGTGTLSLGTGTATVNNLTINAGSLTSTTVTLNVAGDFSNSGTFTHNNGNINFNGAGIQAINSITPPVFNNITFSNSTAVITSTTDMSVSGVLTLNVNSIVNASGKNISLTNSSAASVTAGSDSYIDGILTRAMINAGGTYIFPVGNSTCGSNWLTFSALSGTAPVMRVAFSCNGATTGDATIASPMPININWHVERISGTFTNATVKLDDSEIGFTNSVAQSPLQSGTYTKKTSTAVIGSVTANAVGPIAVDTWYGIGSSTIKTYYSYQSGSWNSSSTWTLDPSGTTQVGSTLPGNDDNIVILSGRTVTLPGNITSTGLDLTIAEGGFLDISTWQFTAGLASLSGQGTLRIAASYFPTIATNNFVSAGGGTTEFRTNINLPSQAVYNNLHIAASGFTVTQTINLTLNGDLYVKSGTFLINDNTSRRLSLTVFGDVTVDPGAELRVGTGVTNSTTNPLGIVGGTAPFINYYDQQSHRIVLNGDLINNGTVRFTNLVYPVFNAFPPTSGSTAGFATVYFQGASDNRVLCGGTTDFYNLVVDKGIDQTFKLTIYTAGSSYANFRLFGANIAGGDGGGVNPNLKKALWIRTGTLILEGLTMIPSLSEGTGVAETPVASPNSDFYIPANGALVLNGTDVIVLSTADDYREVNIAYNTAAPNNNAMGITGGGTGCALSLYGKLQIDNGFISTRESGGIITSSVSAGQFILNNGTVDIKQFLGSTGSASYEQNGGLLILRGRFQRTPAAYSSVEDLVDISAATLSNSRATSGISTTSASFNLENTTNVFTMTSGLIRIYDVCGTAAGEQEAFDVKSSSANINVTGGTVEIIPTTGSGTDAVNYRINTTASLGNLTINRASSTSAVQLITNPLVVLNNFNLASGVLDANNLNLTVGGNFTLENGTTYTQGTNTTILNGGNDQTFTVNLAALSLNKLTIDKPAGKFVNMAGSLSPISVANDFRLILATLNDNGKTLSISSNVYNSGVHTGNGKIALNGTAVQTIDGNGIFENLELNNTNAAAAPVTLMSNVTVNGLLNLVSNKVFNISTYNLIITSTGSISATAFSNSCYIHTSGQSGDGGITKVYSSNASFVFPLGSFSTRRAAVYSYTPATIGFNSSPDTYGSITVIPVGYEHPATTNNGRSLTYYWRLKSNGFSLGTATLNHSYTYSQTDVVGPGPGDPFDDGYVAARYNSSSYSWSKGTVNDVDDVTNNIIGEPGSGTFLENVSFIDGDYTAGDDSPTNPFGTPTKFYSRVATGNWSTPATWSNTGHGGAAASAFPGQNDIVIIGNGNTVNLTANASCASLQIEAGAILDIYTYTGGNFGMVLTHPNGNGLFRVTTPAGNPGRLFTFPGGDFSDFNMNSGTTEFYDIDGTSGRIYVLPSNVTTYGNLILTARGGDNLVLPNNNYTNINGDLTCTGNATTAWIAMSWGNATLYGPASVEKTVNIKGDLFVNAGTFIFMNDNSAAPQHLIVNGDIVVAPGALIEIYNGGAVTANTIDIGGSLINNSSAANSVRFLNATRYANVTFFGQNDAFITNTAGTPTTIFNKVTIDKGSSQSSSLTIDIGGALTTLTDNWLTLRNGTLKFMRTNPGTDFTINTTTQFTIPASAGLYIDYSNTGNRNVLISNNASDASDLYLNGKLTIRNGNVYIGPPAFTNFGNDIEYSGGGASVIEITGGNLFVNGNIRRNPSVSNGVLKYTQSGGNVTINGNAFTVNPSNAKLEVVNAGSLFNMSSGTITIVKGGGTTYGDLYLRPESGSVTGGDIIFAHNISGVNQQYLLDATIPLNNITVTGRTAATAATATVKLMVNPLELNGNLTLTNAQSRFDANSVYNIPVTIKGNFINNGVYSHFNNLTTFSGGAQLLLGSSVMDFYDLKVSPVTSLTLSSDITVSHELSLLNGTLECSSFKVNVEGDVENNATFTNTTSTSGIVLNGTVQQHISGTGTFGQLELDNAGGSTLDNSITLNQDLILTAGIFDISQHLLSLGINSNIRANGTPFGTNKMVTSDGVWSNVGISKIFASPLSAEFTYPLGTPGKYTPAVLTIGSNGHVGSIRINGINSRHPVVIDPANVLSYYWEVEGTGISGFSGSLLFKYKTTDVVGGPESSYIAAQLLKPSTNWSKAATGPGTDNVDETNHTITFNFNNSSNLTGEYTAGTDAAIPSVVPQYTSNQSGNWNDKTIWDYTGPLPVYPCPDGGPNGFIVTINHEVTANVNHCFAYSTTINNKLKAVSGYYGHNFGTITGEGILYVESSVFPAGRYNAFLECSGNGTLEYGGTGIYDINAALFSAIPRILISGTGTRSLPDKDLTICKQLKIDDGGDGSLVLDNSLYNRKLIINGTFERYNNGAFNSGTGSTATVEFAGSSAQTVGGLLGDFGGTNAFNNLEINNPAGLSINNNGSIEINGNLLLTNGIISTSATNRLTINNYSVSCVFPDGGSVLSYIDGPLIKKLNQGDPSFRFPVGKKVFGLANNLSLRATMSGAQYWIVEYFNPNVYPSVASPLTAVNTREYWNVSGVLPTSQAFVDIGWNSTSSLTPVMTQNGISDMRVAGHDGTNWVEIPSAAVAGSDNTNGSAETTDRTVISTGSSNYTLACINTPKPTIRLLPTGPICGAAGIPVELTSTLPIVAPFTVNYTENGTPGSLSPATFPATIPTSASGGTYILTGFTYNYPAGTSRTGAIDPNPVIAFAVPTTADAGLDQSLCGATSATLVGNTPATGTGLWSIISGIGGTLVAPTSETSIFNGTNGSAYTLRWTITNGTCTSYDEVIISFPILPVVPLPFSTSSAVVCQGQTGVVYTVPLDISVTYAWSYSGTGATIHGTGNSVTVDFDLSATNGTLGVTATNSCGPSSARTINITVNTLPSATITYSGSPWCSNATAQSVTITGTSGGTFSAPAGLSINSVTGSITPSASTPGTYTVTYTVAPAGGCNQFITTTSVTVSNNLVWSGTISSDWNTPGNWSCGYIPVSTTLVQIPSGTTYMPVLNTGDIASVNSITIDALSSLTLLEGTLRISGTITNNGTLTATTGTIEMTGSAPQVIGAGIFAGNTIKDLTVNNNAGVTLSGPLSVSGVVALTSGNLLSGGNLTLLSTASGTAMIDGSGTGNVTGNVTMQRYLQSGFGYKYFSSPFQSSTVGEFSDDMTLSSFTFYRYDENRATSGWVGYGNPANPLIPLQGYAVNFGNSAAPRTVDITGIVNNGDLSVNLFNNNQAITQGFNLAGNPYPSPVDWKLVYLNNTNIDASVTYFKAGATDQYVGTYSYYNPVTNYSSDGIVNNIIPSMQGFFIHVSDGGYPVTGNLTLTNNDRITDLTHPFSKKKGSLSGPPLIRLTAWYSDDAVSADPIVIYFDEKGSVEFDGQLDALKLLNTDLTVTNLYTLSPAGRKLAINALPQITGDMYTIPLGLKLNRDGTNAVTLKIRDLDESLTGMRIYLTDALTGSEQDLLPDKEVTVSLAKGEYNNRFFLNLSGITTSTNEAEGKEDHFSIYSSDGILKTTIHKMDGPDGTLNIYNLTGQVLFIKKFYEIGYYEIDPRLKDGIYIISFNSGTFRSTKKLYIQHR